MLKLAKNLAPSCAVESEENPAYVKLTSEERKARPELRDVEALRLFTTKTGVVLTCLITDRKIVQERLVRELETRGYV
jgi:hypothetical protein